MKFKISDRIKYFFPTPPDKGKEFAVGEIAFIGETTIVLVCKDKSRLKISFKNFDRIVPAETEDLIPGKYPS